jgi:biotin/methionine sulfoxide reductase
MPILTSTHWGVYEAEMRSGARPTLKPFRHDPDPNPIGLAALGDEVERLRVRRPAVRKSWLEGGPGSDNARRGREPFVEIDWSHAIDLVAKDLERVRKAHGNTSIFGGSYGWSSAGRFHHAQSQVHRFLNSIGGYVRHVDSYSLGAGRALMPHIVATMEQLMITHTAWDVMEAHTELFVAFGGVPWKNAQIAAGGPSDHRLRPALTRMAKRGVRFVNISPIKDNLEADSVEAEWIAIRPNTDTALMLALAHTLLAENLHDTAFLDRYCTDFTPFADYLLGKTDGQPKTAAWAAAITEVPADRIKTLAREMAQRRTMLNIAWALQRAHHGEHAFWSLVTLAAMLGQIGLPGGGFGLGYGATNLMGSPHARFPGPTLSQGVNSVREFIPVARVSDMLLNPGKPFRYNGATHTYQDIRLVYWAGGNPFHHHQDLNRLVQAWQKPETIIVHEQFWNPLAKMADIVLPATTAHERDDIGFANREKYMIAMRTLVPPTGEARDDYDIFADIAGRVGAREIFTEGRTSQQWLEHMYAESRDKALAAKVALPSFESFWRDGYLEVPGRNAPVVMLQEFRDDPVAHKLATPSGKIEVTSANIAGFKLPGHPGYPIWQEPQEWLGGSLAATYPLHLLSDQPETRLHSQLDHGPHSQSGKVAGRQPVTLHPSDAAARGIQAGDVVRVFNSRGATLAGAMISDTVRAGVIRLSTGSWCDPAQLGDASVTETNGNPNVLTLDIGASDLTQGCAAHTCLVDVERLDGVAPAVTAYDLPEFLQR